MEIRSFSLKPIDVGFDLKLHDKTIPVVVRNSDEVWDVKFEDKHGNERRIQGVCFFVAEMLRKHGYKVWAVTEDGRILGGHKEEIK